METKKLIVLTIMLSVIFLLSCGSNDNKNNCSITGTWESSNNGKDKNWAEIVFESNFTGKMTYCYGGEGLLCYQEEFTWQKYDGNIVLITFADGDNLFPFEYKCGNEFYFVEGDETTRWVKVENVKDSVEVIYDYDYSYNVESNYEIQNKFPIKLESGENFVLENPSADDVWQQWYLDYTYPLRIFLESEKYETLENVKAKVIFKSNNGQYVGDGIEIPFFRNKEMDKEAYNAFESGYKGYVLEIVFAAGDVPAYQKNPFFEVLKIADSIPKDKDYIEGTIHAFLEKNL